MDYKQKICECIEYLLKSNVITIDNENNVAWIHDPELTEYLKGRCVPV
jgi:hypothetical protein